jgi:hypothetical protein
MFHVVTDGRCAIELEGMAPLPLEAADVVMMPRGDAHTRMFCRVTGQAPSLFRQRERRARAPGVR